MALPSTRGLSGAHSKLPRIQHPDLPRGDPESLSVRGFSRSEGRGETDLEKHLKTFRTEELDDWKKLDHWANNDRKHWERNGRTEKKVSAVETNSNMEKQCEELRFRLLEKITSGGFYDLRRLFWSHDPEGRGRVNRDALLIILTTLLGRFIHKSVFQHLLSRLQLEGKPVITFDAFYDHFKLEEDNSPPEWLDPMKRNRKGAMKTAYDVHLELKNMANNRHFELLKLFPNDCLNATELRSVLTKIGIKMSEEEYKKLWRRYAKDDADVLRFDDLQYHLGTKKLEENRGLLLSALQKVSDSQEPQPIKTTNKIVYKMGNERKLSLSIEKWLKEKFREGARAMKTEFSVYDPQGSGMVLKENFLQVLETFHLHLTKDQLGHFLSRCGLDETLTKVNYLEFLQRLQTRSQNGKAYEFLCKPELGTEKRQSRSWSTGSITEDKLVQFFHADFNSLLSEFRKADKDNLKVISPRDFRAILEKRFSLKVTEEEFVHLSETLPVDHDGDIRYLEFMAKFDTRDGNLSIWDGRETVLTDYSRKPKVTDTSGDDKNSHSRKRSVEQVKLLLDDLWVQFRDLDPQNSGYVTREEFLDILQELSPDLTKHQWDTIAAKFSEGQNRISYVKFLQPYQPGRNMNKQGGGKAMKRTSPKPSVVGGLDAITTRLRQKISSTERRNLLQSCAKMDKDGSGLLSLPEFRSVVKLCNMVLDEDDIYHIMSHYDKDLAGKIDYTRLLSDARKSK
ncbi:EF-hand calcium-binding domain-containing protein 6-like isoform X3 [Hyla sarda]|uniref:EF-hand calcium-binding domain-containing protein 6-like isoform X3 n=1 Tax=Hyla sarda TaxID=327740 RepID=UPI0024C335B3|nr:EF-hand calcium-binding domain-containing protein 6-like isoform X3 [Hyla sarda]